MCLTKAQGTHDQCPSGNGGVPSRAFSCAGRCHSCGNCGVPSRIASCPCRFTAAFGCEGTADAVAGGPGCGPNCGSEADLKRTAFIGAAAGQDVEMGVPEAPSLASGVPSLEPGERVDELAADEANGLSHCVSHCLISLSNSNHSSRPSCSNRRRSGEQGPLDAGERNGGVCSPTHSSSNF